MTNPNVQPNTPTSDPWADIAAELHKLADDVLALVGEPAPACFDISIQPRNPDSYLRSLVKNRPAIIATVDAIAMALLDKPSEDHRMSDGTFHRDAKGRRGRISVSILTSIADPNAVDPEQEIARLRAEVAELRKKVQPARPIPPTDPDDLPRAWARADAPEDGELTTPGGDAKALVHYRASLTAPTLCGRAVADLPWLDGTSSDHAEVTCPACIDEAPF